MKSWTHWVECDESSNSPVKATKAGKHWWLAEKGLARAKYGQQLTNVTVVCGRPKKEQTTKPAGKPHAKEAAPRPGDKKYAICIFWSDEDNAHIAMAPELKGLAAHGDTPQQALEEILAAMPDWLRTAREAGWHIPRPRGKRAFSII